MSAASTATAGLLPGFADPVFDSQAVFRVVMQAIAYPGRIVELDGTLEAPTPLDPATAMACLALIDFETPLWLDRPAAAGDAPAYLRFHCGTPIVDRAGEARFAVISDAANMPPLDVFAAGEDQYPDRSATLIVQVPSLTDGAETRWTGPGINGAITARVAGLPEKFWEAWELNSELYPRGIDVFFIAGNAVLGLPRTVRVEA